MQPRKSKFAVASFIVAITGVIILFITVTWKSILFGRILPWAMLILLALAILAIILAAKGENRIIHSNGTLTGRRWATAAGIAGVLLSIVAILASTSLPAYLAYTRRGYDANVKSKLKNAAKAQEIYYRENGTYAAKIDSLLGSNQNDNITMTVKATATTFVITGEKTKGCKANTGIWNLSSTDGSIRGTPCQEYY